MKRIMIFVLLSIFCFSVRTYADSIVQGSPQEIPANPAKGFHWPYYLYIPLSIDSNQLLVITNNTSYRDDNFSVHEVSALSFMNRKINMAQTLGVPFLVPVFPRPDNETDGTIASQYLGEAGLKLC